MKSVPIAQLIVVCCHGIWLGGPSSGADEGEWLIASFQHGETPTFTEHIRAGLRLLSSSPQALLIFSGYHSAPNMICRSVTDVTLEDRLDRRLQYQRQKAIFILLKFTVIGEF